MNMSDAEDRSGQWRFLGNFSDVFDGAGAAGYTHAPSTSRSPPRRSLSPVRPTMNNIFSSGWSPVRPSSASRGASLSAAIAHGNALDWPEVMDFADVSMSFADISISMAFPENPTPVFHSSTTITTRASSSTNAMEDRNVPEVEFRLDLSTHEELMADPARSSSTLVSTSSSFAAAEYGYGKETAPLLPDGAPSSSSSSSSGMGFPVFPIHSSVRSSVTTTMDREEEEDTEEMAPEISESQDDNDNDDDEEWEQEDENNERDRLSHLPPHAPISAPACPSKKHSGEKRRNISSNSVNNKKAPKKKKKKPTKLGTYRKREYKDDQWDQRFHDLVQYQQQHGDCMVPYKWKPNPALAQWVKRQRYQHKLWKDGEHTTLTPARKDALEQLGFVWSSHEEIWNERFTELVEFEKQHGHCNVPNTFPENPPLSMWVRSQRRKYKQFSNDVSTAITPERIERLNRLGFLWCTGPGITKGQARNTPKKAKNSC